MQILALFAGLDLPEPASTVPPCPCCGRTHKNPTGECSFCGTYVCSTCSCLHIGEATRPCPGNGIPVP